MPLSRNSIRIGRSWLFVPGVRLNSFFTDSNQVCDLSDELDGLSVNAAMSPQKFMPEILSLLANAPGLCLKPLSFFHDIILRRDERMPTKNLGKLKRRS